MTVLLWGLGISVEFFKRQKNRSNHIYNPLTIENLRQELYLFAIFKKASIQFSSVAQSCPTLCDPMNCSMPGLPVHHQFPEFTQTHVHPAISSSVVPFSSCPQSLPASGSFAMSQLCMRWPKYWSFSFSISPSNEHSGLVSFRMHRLDLLVISRVFSNTTVQKHQFFGAQLSSQSNSHIHT